MSKKTIGLDVGGNKVLGILFEELKPVKKIKKETPQNKEGFLKVLDKIICDLSCGEEAFGIGVGFAGMIDKNGKILRAPNLSFLDSFNLKGHMEKEFRTGVKIENDVNCFTYAEMCQGAAKDKKNIIGLTLGTGIGGGIIINCKLYRGADRSAGEFGHMIIDGENSFEDLASAKGVFRQADEDIFELEKKAREDDKKAINIFKEVGKNLGVGLANIINILNPDIIVIGGGLSNLGDLVFNPAKETAQKFIANPAAKKTEIVVSSLKDIAIPLGAVLIFKKEKELASGKAL